MTKPGSLTAQPASTAYQKHLRPHGKREAAKRDRKDAKLAAPQTRDDLAAIQSTTVT